MAALQNGGPKSPHDVKKHLLRMSIWGICGSLSFQVIPMAVCFKFVCQNSLNFDFLLFIEPNSNSKI